LIAVDILSDIAHYKRIEVAERRSRREDSKLDEDIRRAESPRGFAAAIERARKPRRPALIAELKKASPSKGVIRTAYDPSVLARDYELGGATCLSVLTDGPSFQGDANHLQAARDATALPCLRKDFLIDPWQVRESRAMGADAILVILAMVDDSLAKDLMLEAGRLGMDALFETHSEVEVDRAAQLGATLIGVNNRDLRTFVTDLAVTERLADRIPSTALLITESGISTALDAARLAAAGAAAMLVGESLMRQDDLVAAVRKLLK
jgi:indole-3-glycerol phosphate synthase